MFSLVRQAQTRQRCGDLFWQPADARSTLPSGITPRRSCEPRDKPVVSLGEDETFASPRIAHAYVRISESGQSHHRRMVSGADSTKPFATLGDSDGKVCRDHDGSSFLTSTVPADASKMGGPHFVDRLLESLPRDACGRLCPPSAGSSGRGTTTRYQ